MTIETSETRITTELRKLMDGRVKAVHDKDVEALIASYAPDVVSFDTVNTLRNAGVDACRKRAEEWFAAYDGDIGFEMRDLAISAGDDVAFCHCLNHIRGTLTNGNSVDMWVRSTICCRKTGGRWLVTHEHTSAPIDGQTGAALTTLQS